MNINIEISLIPLNKESMIKNKITYSILKNEKIKIVLEKLNNFRTPESQIKYLKNKKGEEYNENFIIQKNTDFYI